MSMKSFWASTVLFFKKVGLFLKNYGAWILLVGMGVVFVLFATDKQKSVEKLINEMQTRNKQHRDEVDALQRAHEEELRRYAEIERRYNETIARIQREYADSLAQLDRQKKTELRNIIEETHDDPDEMARRVNSLFGIPLYNVPSPPNS